jgi:hypothetical protein
LSCLVYKKLAGASTTDDLDMKDLGGWLCYWKDMSHMTHSKDEMGIFFSYLLENTDIKFPILPWEELCQRG